jgi:cell division protein FtsL
VAIANRRIAHAEQRLAERSLSIGPVLLAAGVIIVSIGVLQIVQTSRATTANYHIQQLEQEKLELETSVRELEASVAGLSSLGRVEEEARRLGFGPARAREVVEVGVPGPSGNGSLFPVRLLPAPDFVPALQERTHDAPWWRKLLDLFPG